MFKLFLDLFKSSIFKIPSGEHSSCIQMISCPPLFTETMYLCTYIQLFSLFNYLRPRPCNRPIVRPYFLFYVGIYIKIGFFLKFIKTSILCVVLPKSKRFPFRLFPTNRFPSTRNSGFHLVVRIHDQYVLFNLCHLTYWICMIGTVHKH